MLVFLSSGRLSLHMMDNAATAGVCGSYGRPACEAGGHFLLSTGHFRHRALVQWEIKSCLWDQCVEVGVALLGAGGTLPSLASL